MAGLPGGIFAPSLAVGAGVGNLLRFLFPGDPASAVVILGMTAYFAGVVRAPLTAVIILSETTASRGLLLPMFAAAFIADWASQGVCREKAVPRPVTRVCHAAWGGSCRRYGLIAAR